MTVKSRLVVLEAITAVFLIAWVCSAMAMIYFTIMAVGFGGPGWPVAAATAAAIVLNWLGRGSYQAKSLMALDAQVLDRLAALHGAHRRPENAGGRPDRRYPI